MQATSPSPPPTSSAKAGRPAPAKARQGLMRHRVLLTDLAVTALMAAGVLAAWSISRMGLFRSGDDLSYYLAVVGGVMMLLVFLYPLRKHVRALHRLGQARIWLWAHIALGIAGPWLILLHSTFHIGSVNAGVALASMVIVVLSGLVGRFIHVRVHRGLDGERTTLRELQHRAGFVEAEARSRLHFAPKAEALLLEFERRELGGSQGWAGTLRRVLWLPVQQWRVERRAMQLVREAIREARPETLRPPARGQTQGEHRIAQPEGAAVGAQAATQARDSIDPSRRQRHARRLVQEYLGAVVRVAQFSAYDRVFSLWHVAHLPFVVLLVVSAVVHVVAVHAY